MASAQGAAYGYGSRAPSYRAPHAANFPSPQSQMRQLQNQNQQSSPHNSRGTANSVARGVVGSGYGPYTYEHTSDPAFAYTPTSDKFASFSSSPPLTPRRPPPTTSALQPHLAHPAYDTDYDYDEDDALHDASLTRGGGDAQPFVLLSLRGWINVSALLLLLLALLGLFGALPILTHYLSHPYHGPGFNVGGINGSGQIPFLPNLPSPVDKDTPADARTRVGTDGRTYNLVFSDEFTQDGRSFYKGDDPYWEAADLHYWATGDLEWYDPSALTTSNGSLVITLSKPTQPIHDLSYASGMLTSWNRFCFSTGYVEVRVRLPGSGEVAGFWPGVWMMGNLGRAGYGASTEGAWPYSYDSCDLGTFPGQQDKSGNPASSTTDGWDGGPLSGLPGQKLSACTCPGGDHPGPGVGRGRGVPEIDVLEAQVDRSRSQGEVSQSFQIAPFNAQVQFTNSSPATTVFDPDVTRFNSFTGTNLQQSVSAVTDVDNANYELGGGGFGVYGMEYWSNRERREEGYVTWFATTSGSGGEMKETWKITSESVGPDPVSGIGQRLIAEEPMYLILNLGMSPSFEAQDFAHLAFPARMYVDYVRVYQREDVDPRDGVGCDPRGWPTGTYIQEHLNAYSNPNLTTWADAGYTFPRNSKYDGC